MPRKGKTPDSEIVKAVNRLRKYPEYLKSARNNNLFNQFLDKIGIPITTDNQQEFFEKVRNRINEEQEQIAQVKEETVYQKYVRQPSYKWPTSRQMAEQRAEIVIGKDGKPLTYKSTGLPKYRDIETKQFIPVRKIIEGRM